MGKRTQEAASSTVDSFFGLNRQTPEPSNKRPGKTVSVGVHMTTDTRDELTDIADAHDLSRSLLMRYALNWWLKEYRAGRAKIEFEQTRTVKIPE